MGPNSSNKCEKTYLVIPYEIERPSPRKEHARTTSMTPVTSSHLIDQDTLLFSGIFLCTRDGPSRKGSHMSIRTWSNRPKSATQQLEGNQSKHATTKQEIVVLDQDSIIVTKTEVG